MGRMIAKKVKGMNWKAKLSLILIFTLTFSTFMYQGWYSPKHAAAAVTSLNQFPATPTQTATTGSPTAANYTASAGNNRLLLVVVAIDASAGGNTVSATFGGSPLTQAILQNSSRRMTWIGWRALGDSGTNTTASLAVTITGTHNYVSVWAASYSGVDQSSPITASSGQYYNNVNPLAIAATSVGDGGYGIYVWASNNTRTSDTETYTEHGEYTPAASVYSGVASKALPSAGTTAPSLTMAANTRASVSLVTLKQIVSDLQAPTITGFTATTPTNNLNIPITVFTATDNIGVTGYMITENSTPPSAGAGGWSGTAPTTYTVGSSGTYTLYPWAKDAVGNVSTVFGTPRTVVVDNVAPSYTWNSPSAGAWFRDGETISVDATITEAGVGITNGANCNAKIDGGTGSFSGTVTYSSGSGKCTGTLTISTPSGLSEGLHDLTLQVADTAGNTQQSAALSIGLDNAAPTGLLSSSPADEATGQLLDVALQSTTATDAGSGGVQYYFQINDTETYNQNSGWIGSTSFSPPALQYGTTYAWTVKARDAAGNETAPTTPRSFSTAAQCFRNEPSLTFMGSTISTVTADGGTANYTLRVINNDIGGCPTTSFSLTTSEISDDGDNFFNNPTLNGAGSPFSTNSLAPGGFQDITFGVTARAGKTAGRARDRVTSAADAYHPSIVSAAVTTNLNVATCTANIPQLVIGPDAGNVAVGGSLTYSVSLKNTDVGAACTSVTYAVSIVSENPTNPDANFNASTLTYGAQNGTSVNVTLNKGQTDTLTLSVSSKAGSTTGQTRVTTVGASAAGHTAPPNATATTTIGNVLLHNSININSTKWSSFGGWGVPGGKYGEFICNTCHMLDGTTSNIKKVLPAIATPDEAQGLIPGDSLPIVFTRVTGNPGDSGVMGDDSSLLVTSPRTSTDRVCEICHTYDNTGVNGVKVHAFNSQSYTIDSDGVTAVSSNHKNYNAKDCVSCHKHNIGFRPPACTTCHANPPVNAGGLAASPFSTGSTTAGAHAKHVATLGYSCSSCHNNYFMPQESGVTPNKGVISLGFNYQNYTTGTYSGQSNVQYSVNGGAEFTGDGNKNCSNAYCHSIGNLSDASGSGTIVAAGGLSWRTIAWDGAAITCDKCHGDQAGKAHPAYTTGAAGSTTANSHVKHVEGSGLSCDYCHNTTTTDVTIPPTTLVGGGDHLNRVENVAFKSNGGKTGTYDPTVTTGKTCSATYCHGTGPSVQWGGSTTCASCHGANNNGDLSVGATTGHVKHYQSASVPSTITDSNAHTSTAYVFACQNCHPTATHAQSPANGSRDADIGGTKLAGGNYTQGGSWTTDARGFKFTQGGTCSTVCHTKDGVTLGSAIVASPAWNTTNALGCGYCHNKQGDASPTWTAAHTKHVNTYSANANMTCEACHTDTAASNVALQGTAQARNQHPNANRDVAIGAFAGGTWVTIAGAQGSQTCANTYCHSTGTSTTGSHAAISWSGNTTCSSCHRDNTNWTTTTSTGAHWTHVVQRGYNCSNCHRGTSSSYTTISGYANHLDKNATIWFTGAWATTTSSYNGNNAVSAAYQKPVGGATGTCNTTFCHGGVSRNWGTVNLASAQCVKCHGVAGTTVAQYIATPNTAAPGWNTTGVNTAQTVGTITNNVSNDQKVGAHDSHLRNIKGYSGPVACTACHNVTAINDAGHMNGASTMTWSSLVRNQGNSSSWGTTALTPAYSGGSCSSNYCHGYSAWTSVRGTTWTSLVSWTNSSWLTVASAKDAASCNRCHASPPTASTRYNHSAAAMPSGLATDCIGCHGHEGTGGSHIDGVLYGSGNCDSCHSYDTTVGAWATIVRVDTNLWNSTNGWGAHVKHINHLKTRNAATLTSTSDTYGSANFNKVCGFCHSNNASSHNLAGQYTRSIIWNTNSHQFGSSPLNWNTVTRSCSNLDCHYKPSPGVW